MKQDNKQVVGVIGLGIMGGAMAEALVEAGYRVVGADVQPKARQRLKRAGGRPLGSAVAVMGEADIVIASLPSVAALDAVVADIAGAGKSKTKKILIETSTLPIADKERALKALARTGIALLDCPISGTAQRMKQGAWTIFVSGTAAACKTVAPILGVFTRNAPYVGVFGNGSKMKFIANHLVAIYNVSVGESMTFARRMAYRSAYQREIPWPTPAPASSSTPRRRPTSRPPSRCGTCSRRARSSAPASTGCAASSWSTENTCRPP